MLDMEPIEISSSDSDFDLEDIIETNASNIEEATNHRVLPPWDSLNARSNGYAGQSSKLVSPQSASTSGGSSRYIDNRVLERLPKSSNVNDEIRGSSQKTIRDPQNHREAETISQHQTVNSRISTTSGGDYEKLSSQQALKRTLPSTLQHYNPTDHFRSSRDNNIYYNSRASSMNGKGNVKEQFTRGNEEDLILYDDSGRRLLPQTLLHGKSVSAPQFSAEPVYRSGMGDDLVSNTDERLIYQAALQDLNQPRVEAELREGLLSVPLLRHQKIALAWMFQKETKSVHCLGGILADDQGLGKTISIIALIQMQKHSQLSSKPEKPHNDKTEALNLDDDDDVDNGNAGSGNVNQKVEPDVKPNHEEKSSACAFNKKRPAAGTLVVCPASILRQWARELADKVPEEAKLSVLIYHGGNRTKDPVMLATYDVVLTTYSIVTNEVPKQPLVDEDDPDEKSGEKYGLSSEISTNMKRKGTLNKKGKKGKKGSSTMDFDCGPLAKVGWFRVVLDEAQTIKNHRTQVARACCSLRAKRRWCLSGTPIQNAIDDLYSYFRFLKYDPYAVYKSFYNTIKVPISRNSVHGYKKLQAVLRAIMLRRTKGTLIDGQPIVKLPPKLIKLSKVDFSAEERAFYTQLEADSRTQFKAYAAAGTLNQNYANILLMLLRLRQACDHPLLVKGYNSGSVGKVSSEMARRLPKDLLIDLLKCLEASFAICRVCEDPPENPVVTACRHVFCYQCVSEFLTGDDNTCPAPSCKKQLGDDVIFSKATLRRSISDENDDISMKSESTEKSIIAYSESSSSKIRTVLEILQTHCLLTSSSLNPQDSVECNGSSSSSVKPATDNPAEGTTKAIVFSQWTTMLDLVELSLNEYCIQYRRLDGTMSLAGRDRAVKEFNTDPEITVMLMSLKAGNLGLNMVAACHVILLDLWWNPTTEDQAIDRAHRIGQTRPVTVWRITIKDTVEDRIIALQEEKRKMVASAFGEDHMGASAARLTVEDLKYLFMV